LTRIYAEAVAYSGLPGKGVHGQPLTTAAPMTTAAFAQVIGGLTPEQLNQVYDFNPAAWPRVDATMTTYSKQSPPASVAAQMAQGYAAAAPSSPRPAVKAPSAALAPGGTDYSPPDPEIFAAPTCPTINLGGDDGFDLLFASDEAHDIAAIAAQPFVGTAGTVAAAVIAVVITVASALEIPAQTTEMLINISTFCSTNSADSETEVIDRNIVNLDNTSIAMLDLDHQIQTLQGQINQLLDTRTQTVVSKLNTAQSSLNAAQQQAIEESLQGGGGTAIASYELPASLGGYLDTTPIGVQAIVTDALARLQQAQQPVDNDAVHHLADANTDLAAGQYKAAFFAFQDAYRALTK
jgi:hypothetical protein